MKKLFLVALAVAFLMPLFIGAKAENGCSFLQVKEGEIVKEAMIRIVARRVGKYIGVKYPDVILPGQLFCRGFKEAVRAEMPGMLEKAAKYLEDKMSKDPLLYAEFKELGNLVEINIEIPSITPIDSRIEGFLKIASSAFSEGLEMAQRQRVSMLRQELKIASEEYVKELAKEGTGG